MKKKNLTALVLSLASATAFAGVMEPPAAPQRLLFIEGGLSFSHSFYKDSIVTPESITTATPGGFIINPDHFYPNDYWGGYIGASLYSSNWLANVRLDMYSSESKINYAADTYIDIAPVKLSFTLDRVWGDINAFSYWIGAGAVVENTNDGSFRIPASHGLVMSETIQRTRIDPQIEAFAMYRMTNNLGIKFNLGYQIPLNNNMTNGDLNLNLGLNYAFPV